MASTLPIIGLAGIWKKDSEKALKTTENTSITFRKTGVFVKAALRVSRTETAGEGNLLPG